MAEKKKKQHQAIKNLTAVLEAAGTNINNVVKVNVFIDDMANFAAMNEVRKRDKYLQPPCPFFFSLSLSNDKKKQKTGLHHLLGRKQTMQDMRGSQTASLGNRCGD